MIGWKQKRTFRISGTSGWQFLAFLLVLSIVLAACTLGGANASGNKLDQIMERDVVRAGVRFDNPPHSFIDEEGNWVGFDIDIAHAVARELGLELELVRVDELTRISYLQEDNIDMAVASMSKTIRRDEEVDFSQTYFWSKQTFLVRDGEIGSLDELVGAKVGMDRGSSAIGNWRDWLTSNDYPAEADIVEFGNKQAEDYEILASFAKNDPSLVVLGDESIGLKLDGIGVAENNSKLLDAINQALQDIAASGEYDEIYNRWFGPDSDTPVPLQGSIEVWPDG
jgi:polar amino acid transport system substrate-binding protein